MSEDDPVNDDETPLKAAIGDPTEGSDESSSARTGEQAAAGAAHPSDYPGRDYPGRDSAERAAFSSQATRTHSTGRSSPSEPRRPGTGERQAPLRPGPGVSAATAIIPGEILLAEEDVVINEGLPVTTIRVANTADRPVQVGSHFHFAEVNAALDFDREAAWGQRLNVLSGGAVRFEPGAVAEVELVPIRGRRIVRGLRGLCEGELDG